MSWPIVRRPFLLCRPPPIAENSTRLMTLWLRGRWMSSRSHREKSLMDSGNVDSCHPSKLLREFESSRTCAANSDYLRRPRLSNRRALMVRDEKALLLLADQQAVQPRSWKSFAD